jgi:hypothetical protein
MSIRLVIAAVFLSAASAAMPQSLPEMRMTPQEIRASALDTNQIGSSGLPGVHTKVVFGDPSKASLHDSVVRARPHYDSGTFTSG